MWSINHTMLRISTDKSKKSLPDDVYKYDWGDE